MRLFAETNSRMVEGQFLELIHSNDWNTKRDAYMEIITFKTAALMSAACACGALISGASREIVESLNKFGLNLGIAFQLIDDLLDYESSREQFGKPVGKDIKEGKITLPLIYALADMDNKDAKRFSDIFESNSKLEESFFRDLILRVRKSSAVGRIRAEAREYVDKASEMLDVFPESTYKADIIALNDFIAVRQH